MFEFSELLPYLRLGARFVHILSAIFWIGTTLYLTRVARNLVPLKNDPDTYGTTLGAHGGTIWVYVKCRTMPPSALPPHNQSLHYFKWESLATWLSGMLLLFINFWTNEPSIEKLFTGFGLIFAGTLWYHVIWNWIKPSSRFETLAIIASFLSLLGLAAIFNQVLDPYRASYHIAATLATIMAIQNVWLTILPAQYQIVAAMKTGSSINEDLAARAMRCTKHNTYIMPTVLLLMMTMHHPGELHVGSWLAVGIIALIGGGIGHLLRKWL